jgi:hypothetical protein
MFDISKELKNYGLYRHNLPFNIAAKHLNDNVSSDTRKAVVCFDKYQKKRAV